MGCVWHGVLLEAARGALPDGVFRLEGGFGSPTVHLLPVSLCGILFLKTLCSPAFAPQASAGRREASWRLGVVRNAAGQRGQCQCLLRARHSLVGGVCGQTVRGDRSCQDVLIGHASRRAIYRKNSPIQGKYSPKTHKQMSQENVSVQINLTNENASLFSEIHNFFSNDILFPINVSWLVVPRWFILDP